MDDVLDHMDSCLGHTHLLCLESTQHAVRLALGLVWCDLGVLTSLYRISGLLAGNGHPKTLQIPHGATGEFGLVLRGAIFFPGDSDRRGGHYSFSWNSLRLAVRTEHFRRSVHSGSSLSSRLLFRRRDQ